MSSHYYPVGAEFELHCIELREVTKQEEQKILEEAMKDSYVDAVGKFYQNNQLPWSVAESLAHLWAIGFQEKDWDCRHVWRVGEEFKLEGVDCYAILKDEKAFRKELDRVNPYWQSKYEDCAGR